MKTLDQMRGRTCVEFLEWLDATQRLEFASVIVRMDGRFSGQEVNEAWGNVLSYAWKKNVTADDFVDERQYYAWMLSTLRTTVGFMRSNEWCRRGLRNARCRPSESIISEFENDEIKPNFECSKHVCVKDWIAPKWYIEVLESMTKKQRVAFEAMVLGDLTKRQVRQLEGVSVGWNPSSSCTGAIKKARLMIETGKVDLGPSYRVA